MTSVFRYQMFSENQSSKLCTEKNSIKKSIISNYVMATENTVSVGHQLTKEFDKSVRPYPVLSYLKGSVIVFTHTE